MGETDANTFEADRRFRVEVCELIFRWNQLEFAARYLLEVMTGMENFEGQILTAHMANVTLKHAIGAMAEKMDPLSKEHIDHFIEGFDRLRSWRNYFVHGLKGMSVENGVVGGFINEIEARGRLASHQRHVTADEIAEIVAKIGTYHLYASRILGHVMKDKGKNLFAYAPLSTDECPALPAALARNRIYLATSFTPAEPIEGAQ